MAFNLTTLLLENNVLTEEVDRLRAELAKYQRDHEAWEFFSKRSPGRHLTCCLEDGKLLWRCHAANQVAEAANPVAAVLAVKAIAEREQTPQSVPVMTLEESQLRASLTALSEALKVALAEMAGNEQGKP